MPSWNCCVLNCKNNTHGPLRFFSFPKDGERRLLWAESCGRPDWYPTDLSRICEVHFDKSQFEQNQQDGKKLLKWCAIPRMYEEWNKDPSSTTEELQTSKEYDVTDRGSRENVTFLSNVSPTSEVEGISKAEYRERERLKRKRTSCDYDPDYYPDNERHGMQEKEICIGTQGNRKIYAFEKTNELEDELSRIKADIKRLMDDGTTKKSSNVFDKSYESDGEKIYPRRSPSVSAVTNQPRLKGEKNISRIVTSPSSSQRRETTSISLGSGRHPSYSNKISVQELGIKKKITSMNESSSLPHVAKTYTDILKQCSPKQMQTRKSMKKIGSSSQFTIKQNEFVMEEEESAKTFIGRKSSKLSSRQNCQEILDDTIPEPEKDTTDKPWRPPENLLQCMENTVVCLAPEESGTLSLITEPTKSEKLKRNRSMPVNIISTQGTTLKTIIGGKEVPVIIGKIQRKGVQQGAIETKVALPRIVKVQSLNLSKDVVQTKDIPSKTRGARSNNSSKNVTPVIEASKSDKIDLESKSTSKEVIVKKVVLPEFIQLQGDSLLKSSERTGETQIEKLSGSSEIDETPSDTGNVERNNNLPKDTTAMNDISKMKNRKTLESKEENCNPGKSNKGSGLNLISGVENTSESKSTKLKRLLASMLSLEEDMFSDESDPYAVDKRQKKLEVGVQVDESESVVTELKTEIANLTKKLEEKDKMIKQLQQSLAAILPPGKFIMLDSGNSEKVVVFNHEEAPS